MNISEKVHQAIQHNYDPEDLPNALDILWKEMTEDQKYSWLEALDNEMQQELVVRWWREDESD